MGKFKKKSEPAPLPEEVQKILADARLHPEIAEALSDFFNRYGEETRRYENALKRLAANLAEESLKSAEARRFLDTVLNNIEKIAILAISPEGLVVETNRAGISLLGTQTREELIGREIWNLLDKDPLPIAGFLQTAREKGRIFREFPLRRADDSFFQARVWMTPVETPDKKLNVGYVVAIEDISDEKRLMAQLMDYRNLVANSSDAIGFLGLDRRLLSVNQAYLRLFACAEADAIGTKPYLSILEAQNENWRNDVETSLNEKRAWRGEIIDHKKNGRPMVLDTVFFEIRNEEGQLVNYGLAYRDASEQRRMSSELKFLNMQLKEANQAKDRFLGMAAHDLRSPLAGVRLFLEMCVDGVFLNMEEISRPVAASLRQVDTILEMLNELLDVTKIEWGK